MADATKPHGADGASIPPIEIGSFIALRPDKSEFIGSASGVFFANTVFRAFAAAAPSNPAAPVQPGEAAGVSDPGSAHSYLVAAESGPEQVVDGDSGDAFLNPIALDVDADDSDVPTYGLTATGLGAPPSAAAAKKLLMLYFRNWHPFFPFLHGPSFFDQVNRFYEKDSQRDANSSGSALRTRLCRAVIFQCIFNIAGSAQETQQYLDPSNQIKSVTSLTNLLGVISSSHDISSLQALLAVELYLMTRMSLRAASTVHGTLTRILYHSGFHRCPYRYVQLPQEMCDIRQRIFWCAYVLDRQLSQALGHPQAIRDDELDVCIPGMVELHNPVGAREQTSAAQSAAGDEIRAHLPRTPLKRARPGDESSASQHGVTGSGPLDVQSPAHHHRTSPDEVGEYVLGYLVTYSKLVGTALDLFHQSIHSRSITRDNVADLTCKIHSWWNSLPQALQDDSEAGSKSHYIAFFSVAYHYLIIFINRPFLSLSAHRMDFKSSLQSSVTASRTILRTLRVSTEHNMLFTWPGVLSATWMSGLVLAYASLLDIYPLEKATKDMSACSLLLDKMGSTWVSARHCRAALKTLLDRLQLRSRGGHQHAQSTSTPRASHDEISGLTNTSTVYPSHSSAAEGTPSNKRQRMNGEAATYLQRQSYSQGPNFSFGPDMSESQIWQPVLEYTGPDFGFDSNQLADRGEWQGLLNQNFNAESGGLFDIAGWDAYVQSFGDRLNF